MSPDAELPMHTLLSRSISLLSLAAALALVGCASSGVTPMGRDTYMITKSGTAVGSGSGLKADLYREANAWCQARGLVMVPLSTEAADGIPATRRASAELVFRAVKPGDIEDTRTNMRAVPDTVIEIRPSR